MSRYHTIKSLPQQYLAEDPSAAGGKHLLMSGTVYHRTQGTPPALLSAKPSLSAPCLAPPLYFAEACGTRSIASCDASPKRLMGSLREPTGISSASIHELHAALPWVVRWPCLVCYCFNRRRISSVEVPPSVFCRARE